MFKLTINRKNWQFGRDQGYLLDPEAKQHAQCCVGILCTALGVDNESLSGAQVVENAVMADEIERYPILQSGLATIPKQDKSIFDELYSVNDEPCCDCVDQEAAPYSCKHEAQRDRESEIRRLMKKVGVSVHFTGKL